MTDYTWCDRCKYFKPPFLTGLCHECYGLDRQSHNVYLVVSKELVKFCPRCSVIMSGLNKLGDLGLCSRCLYDERLHGD